MRRVTKETEQLAMAENSYSIRPPFQQRFKPAIVKGKINTVLKEELTNKLYDPEAVPILTQKIAEMIKAQVKECAFERYKLVVQVVIGEQRGEGVKPIAINVTLKVKLPHNFWEPLARELRGSIQDGIENSEEVYWKHTGAPYRRQTERHYQSNHSPTQPLATTYLIDGKAVVITSASPHNTLLFQMAARCFWDADTDNFAQAVFMNDSLFCVAAAFGCYHY